MKIKFKFSENSDWGIEKCFGCYLRNPKMQVQQLLETIYFIGKIRIIVCHKNKFVIR